MDNFGSSFGSEVEIDSLNLSNELSKSNFVISDIENDIYIRKNRSKSPYVSNFVDSISRHTDHDLKNTKKSNFYADEDLTRYIRKKKNLVLNNFDLDQERSYQKLYEEQNQSSFESNGVSYDASNYNNICYEGMRSKQNIDQNKHYANNNKLIPIIDKYGKTIGATPLSRLNLKHRESTDFIKNIDQIHYNRNQCSCHSLQNKIYENKNLIDENSILDGYQASDYYRHKIPYRTLNHIDSNKFKYNSNSCICHNDRNSTNTSIRSKSKEELPGESFGNLYNSKNFSETPLLRYRNQKKLLSDSVENQNKFNSEQSLFSIATHRILKKIIKPFEDWLGIQIKINEGIVKQEETNLQFYKNDPITVNINDSSQEIRDASNINTKEREIQSDSSNKKKKKKFDIQNDEFQILNFELSDKKKPDENKTKLHLNAQFNQKIDISQTGIIIETAECGMIGKDFVALLLTVRWSIPEFDFLRKLAISNHLPSAKEQNCIESQLFGAEYTVQTDSDNICLLRMNFKLKCYPSGGASSIYKKNKPIGINLICNEVGLYDKNNVKIDIKNGMLSRSLISVCIIDIFGNEIPNSVVEHAFGPLSNKKIFSFPKYIVPNSEKEIKQIQKSAHTQQNLIFRVMYKGLIAVNI